MWLCKIGVQNWKYVKEYFTDSFLGEKIQKSFCRFRICRRCGKVEEYWLDPLIFGWYPLSEECAKVLKSKVIDKGDFYLLENMGEKNVE